MNWFKPRPPASPPSPPGPVVRNPFDVIPVVADNVEMKSDSHGLIHLRMKMQLAGFRKKVADWCHYDYSRKVELDAYGTLYFSFVNGVNTLKVIVDGMVVKTQKSRKEVEEAVILFTKKLMTMNMILLVVPQDGKKTVAK